MKRSLTFATLLASALAQYDGWNNWDSQSTAAAEAAPWASSSSTWDQSTAAAVAASWASSSANWGQSTAAAVAASWASSSASWAPASSWTSATSSSSAAGIAASLATVTPVTTPTSAGVAPGLASHTVTVGGSSPPAYSPPSISGVVNGDTIVFIFETANHTVTQSSFDTPCEKVDSGFKSGFVPSNGTIVPYMVAEYTCSDPNDMCTPTWLYCGQSNHCEQGMRFSINALSAKDQAWRLIDTLQNPQSSSAVSSTSLTSSTSVVAPPAASSSSGVVQGSGWEGNQSCSCSCFCGSTTFPEAAQGVGMMGGLGGSIPASQGYSSAAGGW